MFMFADNTQSHYYKLSTSGFWIILLKEKKETFNSQWLKTIKIQHKTLCKIYRLPRIKVESRVGKNYSFVPLQWMKRIQIRSCNQLTFNESILFHEFQNSQKCFFGYLSVCSMVWYNEKKNSLRGGRWPQIDCNI